MLSLLRTPSCRFLNMIRDLLGVTGLKPSKASSKIYSLPGAFTRVRAATAKVSIGLDTYEKISIAFGAHAALSSTMLDDGR